MVDRLTHWQTSRFLIALRRPQVMGIVNVTPDSFSDGGLHASANAAKAHCDQLLREGADILDIGGESTRPGARQPDLQEELARVLPVLRHAVALGLPVSVDTSRPEVMRAALDLGVDIINDVRSLGRPGALALVAGHASCGVCLMHMQGEPGTMQQSTHYDGDGVIEVAAWLAQRLAQVHAAGVALNRITLDPGIGFGKTPAHNLALIRGIALFHGLGCPVLLGASRKGFIGSLSGVADPVARMPGSVAVALAAVAQGVQVLRVHDVAATRQALDLWQAIAEPEGHDL